MTPLNPATVYALTGVIVYEQSNPSSSTVSSGWLVSLVRLGQQWWRVSDKERSIEPVSWEFVDRVSSMNSLLLFYEEKK